MADKMSSVGDLKVALVCYRLSMGFVLKPAQDPIFDGGLNFVSSILIGLFVSTFCHKAVSERDVK
jgi:hypothetical protein